jgi:uncharacterized protein (DUF433 family)
MEVETTMATEGHVDWSQCPLVETSPDVQSGSPVLRGTRMPVSAIVDNFDYGVSVAEISQQFAVPADRVQQFWPTPRAIELRIRGNLLNTVILSEVWR